MEIIMPQELRKQKTITIHMKTPDCVDQAIEDSISIIDEDKDEVYHEGDRDIDPDLESEKQDLMEEYREKLNKVVDCGDSITLVYDIESGTLSIR